MSLALKATFIVSILLIALGLGSYFGTGTESYTALIPTGFGVLLLICGLASRGPKSTKIAMHVAVLLAALGAAGSARVFGMPEKFTEPAGLAQLTMFALCVVLAAIYVRSFIAARRAGATDG